MVSKGPSIGNNRTSEFRIISWQDAMESYSDDFAILARSLQLSPTHLPDWLDIIVSTRGRAESVHVLLIEENDQVVGVVPYYVTKQRILGMSVTVLELVTNIVSCHATPITSIKFEAIWQYLNLAVPKWHILRALNFVDKSVHSESLLEFAKRNSYNVETLPAEQSPYLPIDSDWQSFLQAKNKKFRYKIRQREKLLLSDDTLSIETITGSNFNPDVFAMILEIEKNSWKAKYGLDIATRHEEQTYYKALLPYLARANLLQLVILYKGSRPIAYSLCVSSNRWFGQLKTSFDERFSDLSPGAIVVDDSIHAAFESQASEFDFLGDMDRHKLGWTKSIRRHVSHFVYRNAPKSKAIYLAKRLKNSIVPIKRVAATKPS